jgi:hypothetical protein
MTIIEGDKRVAAIRDLNDDFRRSVFARPKGRVLVTSGVNGFGPGFAFEVMTQCARFDAFTDDNDPHGEHDFGEFEVKGRKLFWKIDYYDIDMEHGSDDPADPDKTTRVITVMLAEEY